MNSASKTMNSVFSGELSGVEEELTKLQDESRQTFLGFREYMRKS